MQRLPVVKIETCQTSGHIALCDTFIRPCVQWQQFLHQPTGHPQLAFCLWLQLYSALLTTDGKHLLMDWPIYHHEKPATGWQALLARIKKCLSQAVEPTC